MNSTLQINHHQSAPRWWQWIITLGIAWGLLLTAFGAISSQTSEDTALMFAIWSAGIYTLLLRLTQKWWLPKISKHPVRNAFILGAFNAAVVETKFLFFEKVFGAENVAANPNLIIDLLMTMPWYILMCLTFVKVQNRWRFPAATVLFLGAIYELGADGIVGPLLEVFSGNFYLFSAEYWLQMMFFFWAFILVYSSMLLPSSWLIEIMPAPEPRPSSPAWRAALKPMLWLIPFAFYVLAFVLIYSQIS